MTWQDAIGLGTKPAHEAWRLAGLHGPHVVLTRGAIDGGDRWVLIHGASGWLMDADEAAEVWDPPAVVVDKITGEVEVLPAAMALVGRTATIVGDVPEHLRWD